jgi:glycosyltransferase involved in cell wall biosynthesis
MSRRSLNAYQLKHPIFAKLERLLHRNTVAIAGNSKRVIDELHDQERVPLDKLFLIYNGIALEPFDQVFDKRSKRGELGLPDDALTLITVGNLIEYKGHSDLIAAVGGIKCELPPNWVLLVVGQDHGMGQSLKQMTDLLGIAEHVRFLGQRLDVTELLRISDIALLCSHEEGFSNALLEAMAAGLPVIATKVGGNTEAVLDGVTGLLVPARDTHAIANAILRLARDAEMRQRMGEAGARRVRRHFSLDACVDGYERLYRSLFDRDAASGTNHDLSTRPSLRSAQQ